MTEPAEKRSGVDRRSGKERRSRNRKLVNPAAFFDDQATAADRRRRYKPIIHKALDELAMQDIALVKRESANNR